MSEFLQDLRLDDNQRYLKRSFERTFRELTFSARKEVTEYAIINGTNQDTAAAHTRTIHNVVLPILMLLTIVLAFFSTHPTLVLVIFSLFVILPFINRKYVENILISQADEHTKNQFYQLQLESRRYMIRTVKIGVFASLLLILILSIGIFLMN